MKKKKQTAYMRGLDNLDGELTIPSFMIWFRSTRGLNQRELADLLGIQYARITQLEKSRYVLPYKTLRLIYQKILTKAERQYFLTCLKGHMELLMEADNDDEFREKIKTPNLIDKARDEDKD